VDFLLADGDRMNQLLKSLAFSALLAISGVAVTTPINVNTATQTELESIKGIGPSKAKTIIAERLDGGHFQDANDLQKWCAALV
jgi:competence protein ComEA